MIKLILSLFEPIFEAFALDRELQNSPQMLIECGQLNDYSELEDDGI